MAEPIMAWTHVEHTAGSGNRITAEIREGEGPTLVLVPGTWGNARTRGRLVEGLDRNLKLVCVALAGQDDNWPPPRSPSIPGFTDEVMDLADALGLGPFYVGGNSLGGMIAVDALRFGSKRIRGAVSIEGWTHSTVSADVFGGDTNSTLDPEQRDFLRDVRKALLDRWSEDDRTTYASVWRRWDGWEILAATEIPVLEIWGDRGRPQPTREAMRIPDRPNIEVKWIPGASHNLLIEAPDRVAELINRFTGPAG